MKTPRNRIADVITKQLIGGDPKKVSRDLAAYLLDEGRVGELDSLLRDVTQQRADAGMVEVLATSAYPLNDKVRNDIKSELKALYPNAQNMIISEQIDPNVVGGVKIELPNQQLDLSIRSKLNRFKQLTATGDN